jgi:hypothetical protein
MLGMQLAKDGHPQLAKVCDVAELVRRLGALNWTEALRQAKKRGGRRTLLFGMGLAGRLLKSALPHEVVTALERESRLCRIIEHRSEKLFQVAGAPAFVQMPSQELQQVLRERLRDKISIYYSDHVRGAIIPCELDERLVRLPGRLSFLYYLVRPIRLLVKYGSLLLRRTRAMSAFPGREELGP